MGIYLDLDVTLEQIHICSTMNLKPLSIQIDLSLEKQKEFEVLRDKQIIDKVVLMDIPYKGWKKISDGEIPPVNESVLVSLVDGRVMVGTLQGAGDFIGYWHIEGIDSMPSLNFVEAWMEKPKPFREEKENE